jgi:hypothetical protein
MERGESRGEPMIGVAPPEIKVARQETLLLILQ